MNSPALFVIIITGIQNTSRARARRTSARWISHWSPWLLCSATYRAGDPYRFFLVAFRVSFRLSFRIVNTIMRLLFRARLVLRIVPAIEQTFCLLGGSSCSCEQTGDARQHVRGLNARDVRGSSCIHRSGILRMSLGKFIWACNNRNTEINKLLFHTICNLQRITRIILGGCASTC